MKRLRAAWARTAEALRVSERAEEAAASADAAAQAQSRFMANLAHELKNPLNAIYGYAQFMRLPTMGATPTTDQDKLAIIESAARHLIGLTGDILTSEQIETGRLQVDPAPFDIAGLVAELVELERSAIKQNNNLLVVDVVPHIGSLVSDRRRLAQILINLISNAAKFTNDGEIRIAARRDEDGSVCMTVADSGVGIPSDKCVQMFQAFSDIGGKASRDAGGHGLGLFITAGLVRRLGGTISVESKVGEGTRMHLWLPDLSGAPRATEDSDPEVLTIGFTQSLPALDPLIQELAVDAFVLGSIFECLTALDHEGRVIPQLAHTWQQIDAHGWLFQLNPAAQFHNGDRLTAADVIATLERQQRMLRSGSLVMQTLHPEFEAYEARDDHTIVLRTREPAPLFLEQIAALPILHRSVAEVAVGAFELKHAIGTGPYRVADYGSHGFRLVAYPRPGRRESSWKVIIGRNLRTVQETERALLSRRLDVVPYLGREVAQRLEKDAAVRVLRPATNTVFFLQPNLYPNTRNVAWWPDGAPIDANPLLDVRVRRALSLAIDRDFLCEHALLGGARPLGSVVPSNFFGHNPTLRPEAFDPERAEHLLRLAGYPDGLTISMTVAEDVESDDHQLLRSLRAQLATVGIDLRPNIISLRDFADQNVPTFGLLLMNWVSLRPDAELVLRDFGAIRDPSRGFGNYSAMLDADIDAILRRAARCLDRAERDRLLKEASALIARDSLLIPLVEPSGCMACGSHLNVTGHIQLALRPDQVSPRVGHSLP